MLLTRLVTSLKKWTQAFGLEGKKFKFLALPKEDKENTNVEIDLYNFNDFSCELKNDEVKYIFSIKFKKLLLQ